MYRFCMRGVVLCTESVCVVWSYVLILDVWDLVLQARVGRKVLARERISPYRKDVLTTKAGKNVRGHTNNRDHEKRCSQTQHRQAYG